MGPEKGQQEAHDVPEDVSRPQELRPVWGDLQGEEEAHLPVQPGHPDAAAEETARKLITPSCCCVSLKAVSVRSSGLQHYPRIVGLACQCYC